MQLVTAFTETVDEDTGVKYEEFLHIISRNGEVDGLEQQYRTASQDKIDGMSNGRPSEKGMREAIEKVKQEVGQASGGLIGLEQALRRVGAAGGNTVTQDDLIIALSRIDAQLSLDDVKEFFSAVKGSKERCSQND